MNVRKTGIRTLIINGKELSFDKDIGDIIELEDRVLIELDAGDFPDDDPEAGRNIYAYDGNGEILWRVQDAGFTSISNHDHETEVPQGYTGMGLREDGRIVVNQPIGCAFDLDPETGEISNMELGR